MQCRVLGGHLIQWLKTWGPGLLAERAVIAPLQGLDPDPVIVYVTDTPGLVAATQILSKPRSGVVVCTRAELDAVPKHLADPDFRVHCELQSYFETSLSADQERELRQRYSLSDVGTLWVHHTCSILGPLFARGAKHLWRYDGELELVEEAFERWVS